MLVKIVVDSLRDLLLQCYVGKTANDSLSNEFT